MKQEAMVHLQLVVAPSKSLHGNFIVKFLKNDNHPWQYGDAPGDAGSMVQSTPGSGVADCAMAGEMMLRMPPFWVGTAVNCPTIFCQAVEAAPGLKSGAFWCIKSTVAHISTPPKKKHTRIGASRRVSCELKRMHARTRACVRVCVANSKTSQAGSLL